MPPACGVVRTFALTIPAAVRNSCRVAQSLDGAYNGGTVASMHDELRKIIDDLYPGMSHAALGGGAINPAPFLLTKAPEEDGFKVVRANRR